MVIVSDACTVVDDGLVQQTVEKWQYL